MYQEYMYYPAELKPCTCGSRARVYAKGCGHPINGRPDNNVYYWGIYCSKCGSTTGVVDTEEQARRDWNSGIRRYSRTIAALFNR